MLPSTSKNIYVNNWYCKAECFPNLLTHNGNTSEESYCEICYSISHFKMQLKPVALDNRIDNQKATNCLSRAFHKVRWSEICVPVKDPDRSCYRTQTLFLRPKPDSINNESQQDFLLFTRKWKRCHHFSMINKVYGSRKTSFKLDSVLSSISTAWT